MRRVARARRGPPGELEQAAAGSRTGASRRAASRLVDLLARVRWGGAMYLISSQYQV